MSENCMCPLCRHRRGEITDREMAWYLKGKIEFRNTIPISLMAKIDSEVDTENGFKLHVWDAMHDDEYLADLVKKMEAAGETVDPALRQPHLFIPGDSK